MASRHPYPAGYGVGAVLAGRYQIDFILAQRSANVVCLGRDLMQIHPAVVIYSLPDVELAHRVDLVRRLFQDAQIVHVLRRDDLVPILDFNVEPQTGTLFLVLAQRPQVPAEQLAALAGPESKTAAVFSEMARGLLESHDAQFFNMGDRENTNPGVRLSDLPQGRQGGPALPGTGSYVGEWRQNGPKTQSGAERIGGTKLTRTHIAVVGLVTLALAIVVLVVSADQGYYGPREIRRGMWQDYYGSGRTYRSGPGLMDGTDPRTQGQITVISNPPGAEVYAGVKPLGATPMQLNRPNDRQQLLLRVSKPGYVDQTLIVTRASPAMLTVMMGKGLGSAADTKERPTKSRFDRMGRLPSYDLGKDENKAKRPNSGTYDTTVRGQRRERRRPTTP